MYFRKEKVNQEEESEKNYYKDEYEQKKEKN